jgi:hypothetical protein
VALFALYLLGMAGILWYTMFYLPFAQYTQTISFALNIIQYSLLSLLSFLTYRQETHFRSIFFQFWIAFAAYALMVPLIYHMSYWGKPGADVAAYVECEIGAHVLWMWIAVKALAHYTFHAEKGWRVNALSLSVVLPLSGWLFWPYWWSPGYILSLPTAGDVRTLYGPIQTSEIAANAVSLLLLLAFFVQKLKTDRPFGAFADTMLFLFGLTVIVNTVEIVAQVKSLELMNITQWAFGGLAAAMIVTLILRLRYKSQAIANYYESQFLSADPSIGRRIGLFDRLVLWCFFDKKEIGQRIFLGTNGRKVSVRRSSPTIRRPRPGTGGAV